MSNNDKKMKNIDIDDMKIKSHLNDSLEMSGISVSEDLINRTLEAIKKQPVEIVNHIDSDSKVKIIPWTRYIRTVAGVAAAVIVVVVGYQLAGQGLLSKSSKDSANVELAADQTNMAVKEMPVEEGTVYSTTMDSSDIAVGNADSTEGVTSTPESEAAPRFSIAADNALQAQQPLLKAGGTGDEVTLTFRDIFLSDPTQAVSILITDETNGNSITLSTQEQISDFYTVMDNHQFTYNSDSHTVTGYTVVVNNGDSSKAIYDMMVGENVIVNYNDGESSSQSVYLAMDQTLLLQNLQELYQKYSE